MKSNVRILVSQACNYSCQYCCNKIDGMMDKFYPIDNAAELHWVIYSHENICISGGEPLLPQNLDHTMGIAALANEMDKKVFIYSNMSVLPPESLVPLVDGWSIGYHPTQTDVESFAYRVNMLILMGARGVRVLVEDTEVESLRKHFSPGFLKTWKRNECDKQAIEDWYILKH